MRTANRVAMNSLALYANMLVTLGVSLLATRFVLLALGSTEYGAYVLIANIVAMFSFINVAMSVATQRYISYAMGTGDMENVKEVFYNNLLIHICIAAVLAVVIFVAGVPAVECWLKIPPEIRTESLIVLLCMVINVVFLVVSVPYEGLMNAKEDIVVIAGINIADAVFKFMASVVVLFIDSNQLVVYAALIMCSGVMVFLLKKGYCINHYSESHFEWHEVNDASLVKKMMGFAGWNLIGAGCSLARYQGAAILLNKFFDLAVNAAYGISQQLNGFLLFFANSAVRPMRPQIVKNEAAGFHKQMIKLASTTSKFSFILLCIVIIPLYINMPYVLEVWLVEIPAGVLEFCRGFLLIALIGQLSVGLQIALESVGQIKLQQIIVGFMHLMPLPVAYILFEVGYSPSVIMYCIVVEELVCLLLRVLIARIDAYMPIAPYASGVILPCTLLAVITFFLVGYFDFLIVECHPVLRFVLTTLLNLFMVIAGGYFLCFSDWERQKINSIITAVMRRFLGVRR